MPASVTVNLELGEEIASKQIPSQTQLRHWVEKALINVEREQTQLNIKVVSEKEMSKLNESYRGKSGPTNTLSFPYFDMGGHIAYGENEVILGDIAVCAQVLEQEASEQKKNLSDHWAHIVIHSVLHLQGYDHQEEDQAEEMEQLEVKLLAELNIANPYKPHGAQ